MNNYTFRLAKETDAGELLDIYAPYVLHTAITFEYESPTIEDFTERIANLSSEYPYIVCLHENRIVGYAYAHRQRERAAYQWNAELSVYIRGAHQGCGLGKKLYGMLLEILMLQNIRNVYGGVTAPNPGSERLHEALGFQRVGTYHNTGYKCGSWHDVIWFEKSIAEASLRPQPFLTIKEIDPAAVEAVLSGGAGK